jgi:ribosomal protein S18 acetylase RimI-like enzyme
MAIKDGKVVGFIQMSTASTLRVADEVMMHKIGPKEAYIEMAAVGPDARGHGVGTKLLQWCEDLALKRGCTTLSLGVVAG